MNRKETRHATYMIVYPIVDTTPAMTLWRETAKSVLQLMSSVEGLSFPGEPYITLCTPWRSSFAVARELHHELLASDVAENHTDLRLGELAFFENKDEDILYFNVNATPRFRDQTKQMRIKFYKNPFLEFADENYDAIGQNIHLHLTVCTRKNLASLPVIQAFVKMYNKRKKDSMQESYVGTVRAQMCAQYKDGWKPMHENPEHRL